MGRRAGCLHLFISNHDVKNGRDPVEGVDFDGNYTIDLENSNTQFVVDFGNDKRFIMVFSDETNLAHCNIYQLAGYSGNSYSPFGADELNWLGQDYEVRVTNLYVASSNPSSIYRPEGVTGINDQAPQPFDNTDNQPETVCGFLLYADSATKSQMVRGTYHRILHCLSSIRVCSVYQPVSLITPQYG